MKCAGSGCKCSKKPAGLAAPAAPTNGAQAVVTSAVPEPHLASVHASSAPHVAAPQYISAGHPAATVELPVFITDDRGMSSSSSDVQQSVRGAASITAAPALPQVRLISARDDAGGTASQAGYDAPVEGLAAAAAAATAFDDDAGPDLTNMYAPFSCMDPNGPPCLACMGTGTNTGLGSASTSASSSTAPSTPNTLHSSDGSSTTRSTNMPLTASSGGGFASAVHAPPSSSGSSSRSASMDTTSTPGGFHAEPQSSSLSSSAALGGYYGQRHQSQQDPSSYMRYAQVYGTAAAATAAAALANSGHLNPAATAASVFMPSLPLSLTASGRLASDAELEFESVGMTDARVQATAPIPRGYDGNYYSGPGGSGGAVAGVPPETSSVGGKRGRGAPAAVSLHAEGGGSKPKQKARAAHATSGGSSPSANAGHTGSNIHASGHDSGGGTHGAAAPNARSNASGLASAGAAASSASSPAGSGAGVASRKAFVGVSYVKRLRKFRSFFTHPLEQKTIGCGSFKTAYEAARSRYFKLQQLPPHVRSRVTCNFEFDAATEEAVGPYNATAPAGGAGDFDDEFDGSAQAGSVPASAAVPGAAPAAVENVGTAPALTSQADPPAPSAPTAGATAPKPKCGGGCACASKKAAAAAAAAAGPAAASRTQSPPSYSQSRPLSIITPSDPSQWGAVLSAPANTSTKADNTLINILQQRHPPFEQQAHQLVRDGSDVYANKVAGSGGDATAAPLMGWSTPPRIAGFVPPNTLSSSTHAALVTSAAAASTQLQPPMPRGGSASGSSASSSAFAAEGSGGVAHGQPDVDAYECIKALRSLGDSPPAAFDKLKQRQGPHDGTGLAAGSKKPRLDDEAADLAGSNLPSAPGDAGTSASSNSGDSSAKYSPMVDASEPSPR